MVIVLAGSGAAQAQINNSGVLDSALKHFRTAAQGWEQASLSAAMTLFWMLATISLVWTVGQLAVKRADLGEFFAELIRYLLFTGFWAWMLQNGPSHARLIVDSMQQLGGTATDRALLTPSKLVDVGFHLLERSLTQSSILSPVDSTIAITLSLIIVVVLALVAVNMLVLLVAIWVVAYGGLIILGFGGSRWTSDMAINYYKTVASLGLQAFAMALLVGVGQTLMEGFADSLASNAVQGLEGDTSLHEQAVLLVVSTMLLALVTKVPPLIGGLVTGASIQHSMGNGAGAGAALSAGSTGLALATTMGGAQLMGLARSGVSTAAGPVESGLKDAFSRGAGVSFGEGGDDGDSHDSGGGGGCVFAVPTDAGTEDEPGTS
ncbi:MAG: P-type conjugative transfer protein TrbL, partial [Myxococcales bacterium]|nr:P-type conjugative transfer protein TrbL [Myxococcales bacterium]